MAEFQSTLPARGATRLQTPVNSKQVFQSTLPARGATKLSTYPRAAKTFQSTLPARGATEPFERVERVEKDFNPRSPHGERRHCGVGGS